MKRWLFRGAIVIIIVLTFLCCWQYNKANFWQEAHAGAMSQVLDLSSKLKDCEKHSCPKLQKRVIDLKKDAKFWEKEAKIARAERDKTEHLLFLALKNLDSIAKKLFKAPRSGTDLFDTPTPRSNHSRSGT